MEYSLKESLCLIRQLKTNICFLSQGDRELKRTPYRKRLIKNLKSAFEIADALDSLFCTMLFDEEEMERILKAQQEEEDFITQTIQCSKIPSRKRFAKGRIL